MSQQISRRVWDHSQARGPAHHVLLAIADRADDDGVAWPSMGDISRRCGVGVATVQRAVTKLIELKEIEVSEGGLGKRSNRYVVLVGRDQGPPVALQSGTLETKTPVPERNKKPRSVPLRNANLNGSRSGAEYQSSGAEHKDSSRSALSNEPTDVGMQASKPAPPIHGPRIPDWAQSTIDALEAKGIVVSWQRNMSDLRWAHFQQLLRSHGQKYLVHLAGLRWQPNNPIKFGTLLLEIWQEYPAPKPGSPWLPAPAGIGPQPRRDLPPYCGDIDCDEVTRFREIEDANGLRVSTPCPQCHPNRKKNAA